MKTEGSSIDKEKLNSSEVLKNIGWQERKALECKCLTFKEPLSKQIFETDTTLL